MHPRLLALACLITATTTFAADAPKLPSIAASGNEKSERHTSFPEQPIAQKKDLLFADDFEKAELGCAWKIVVPTFSIEKGALKGTQMRCVPTQAAGTLASL